MKCIKCQEQINEEDNFCWNCGYLTIKGHKYFQDEDNIHKIFNGEVAKQNKEYSKLIILLLLIIISFFGILLVTGKGFINPFIYLKKQITNQFYGYKTSPIKTTNKYDKQKINTYEEALKFIEKDFDSHEYQCNKNNLLSQIEYEIENKYSIPSVLLCDISSNEAQKIKDVIDKTYSLFPNIKGWLTNITITNVSPKKEYIARFQPLYQFININEDINNYNKVNKTQILLNSYYYLNRNILDNQVQNEVGENWYVKDATWESIIAHELGHYILFKTYLKENNLENITLITKDNFAQISEITSSYGNYSLNLLKEANENYQNHEKKELTIDEFALSISNYAGIKNDKQELIADETIAESIHDYYLHENLSQKASLEIVDIIKRRLSE